MASGGYIPMKCGKSKRENPCHFVAIKRNGRTRILTDYQTGTLPMGALNALRKEMATVLEPILHTYNVDALLTHTQLHEAAQRLATCF